MDSGRVREMADEVAALMAERLGGRRRGAGADLATMIRRRGGALPRRLRREARVLLEAERLCASPRIARQIDPAAVERAHAALVRHLRPLGSLARWQGRGLSVAAAIAFGLMVLGAAVIWVLSWRGYL